MAALRTTAIALALLLGLMGGGLAQTTPAPPQPLPKEQFDALVEAVKKAVADELKAQGATTAAKPETASPASAKDEHRPDVLGTFRQRLMQVIAALPQANASVKGLGRALDESSTGGRGTWSFLTVLLAAMVVAVAVEVAVRAALGRLKMRLAPNAIPTRGMRSLGYLGLLALLDGIAVVGFWLASELALSLVFPGAGSQPGFAHAAMAVLLVWRVNALVLRLVFRPDLAAGRLCELDDRAARHLYRSIVGIMLFFIFLRFLAAQLAAFAPSDIAIAASRLITSPIVLVVPIWLIVTVKPDVQQWLGGLGRTARYAGFIGRHWLGIAISLIVALVATQLYGAITDHLNAPKALLLTLNLLVGVLLFETLLQAFVRRLDSQLPGFTPASAAPTLADVFARCVRVAVLIGVIVAIGESWVVNVLGLVDANAWDRVASESRTAGITLFTAYVLWEIFKYGTESYLHRHATGDATSTATRLHTLIPLLRITVAIVLTVVAVLIALENIGVNVTPLLAGASVLGLALSFGSQTLVRDIVSGVFYLTDDAFRVGEFIDSEKAKGTVEGFTLRSVRLRNESGQLHTVPFGELGRVTNYSRDWRAVDFSLRFPRDTDLDKLRQATDKVSGDIMAVPELRQMLLEPLKMQGIAEVTDNALAIRFKFVTRPGDPATVQHEAMTRMLRTLPELGIAFAK
ncbi:Small-conductance mechanosensitive channel [Rhodospirillales bacterium URHD0017]|nr:Small-conductance mechanosensitive channel [Rhodospirillales bacterium URHD0017]